MSLPALKAFHKRPYFEIDSSRAELSQAGRTILVTGGNGGIGFAIARAFVLANAHRVLVLGRRDSKVDNAVAHLHELAKSFGKSTLVDGHSCDIANPNLTKELWKSLDRSGIYVDVMVLNAATFGNARPILESPIDEVWEDFEYNVRSTLDMTHHFYHQEQAGALGKRKFLVHVSSAAAYMWSTMNPQRPAYGLTKNASLCLLQQIAKDTKVTDMQIVSFHPGGVLTQPGRRIGLREDMGFMFDHEDLPGSMGVWSASTEAEFLHGRFVWSNWDMGEIKNGSVGKQISEDEHFLKVGIEGLTERWADNMTGWYGSIDPSFLPKEGEV